MAHELMFYGHFFVVVFFLSGYAHIRDSSAISNKTAVELIFKFFLKLDEKTRWQKSNCSLNIFLEKLIFP